MVAPRETAPAGTGLLVHPLAEQPLVAALPLGHPLAARPGVAAGELACEPFVLFAPEQGEDLYARVLATGIVPRVVQEALAMSTITALVAAGVGVSIVPEGASAYHADRVVYRPLTPRTTYTVALVTAGAPSAILRSLTEHELPQ
jgi:DNA-binding transcriptional LysR family regulator